MQHFDTLNFERQGNTENDLHLQSTEEVSEALINLSTSALRSIKIFTPDLEHMLYDTDAFKESLLNFARGNRHAQVQILVSDISFSVQRGHRLIRLAQQLTSAMQIKITPEDYTDTKMSFIQVDQSDFLFKADSSKQQAIQCNCKNRSNKLLEFFTPAWEQAELAPHTQQYHI